MSSPTTFISSITWDMNQPLPNGRFVVLERRCFEHFGDVALCKKGREGQEKTAQAQLDLAKQDQATRQGQLTQEQPIINELSHRDSGGLSDFARQQYGADLGNINQTYSNARQNGLRSIGQRGLQNAPTGAESSLLATADMGQARDENSAYNAAWGTTLQNQLEAANILNGLQGIYNPNQAYQGASDSFYKRSNMGSTLGDIGGGIATAAGAAGGLMTGLGGMGVKF